MGERAGTNSDRDRRGWARTAAWTFGLTALVPAAALAVGQAGARFFPPWDPARAEHERLLISGALPAALLACAVLCWGLSAWYRRGARVPTQLASATSAVLALMLGGTSYVTCAGFTPTRVAIGVLNLFTGQVEQGISGQCLRYPEVFDLARLFGLAALFFGALAVLEAITRPTVERILLWGARRVDVVVGLDSTTLPLVAALCAERNAARRPTRFKRRRAWRYQPRATPRSTVVVVHANDADPLVAEARSMGARVYVGDPHSAEVQQRVILGRRRRIRLHRWYAFTESQRDNVEIVQGVSRLIAEQHSSGDTSWLARDLVPRVVARFTDAREARVFRLRHVAAVGCLVDAVSVDGMLARALIDRVAEYGVTHLAITGDSPLTVALLDQLAQQRYFRHEVQEARELKAGEKSTAALNALNAEDQILIDEVRIVASSAQDLCEEWARTRAPASAAPQLLLTAPSSGMAWKGIVKELENGGGVPCLIITDDASPMVSTAATRLCDSHPRLLVLRPSINTQGVEPLTGSDPHGKPGSVVVRYGPTLMHDDRPPTDTWSVLARQQHEAFAGRRWVPDAELAPSRRFWPRSAADTHLPLADFFMEDNLRQHRHFLMLIEQAGYEWRVAEASSTRSPGLTADDKLQIARSEHERWCAYRKALGWRAPTGAELAPWEPPPTPSGEKGKLSPAEDNALKKWLDENRRNKHLVDWVEGDLDDSNAELPAGQTTETVTDRQRGNVAALAMIVNRLQKWGVEPWPISTDGSAP